MKRTTIWLTEDINASLTAISTPRVKKAEHIRRAIDMYFSTASIQHELKVARSTKL